MKSIPPSEVPMYYTANEVMEMLEWARTRGATFARIGIVEIAWEFADAPAVKAEVPAVHNVRQGVQPVQTPKDAERCPDCRDYMIPGNWGRPYCVACYKAKQDRKR